MSIGLVRRSLVLAIAITATVASLQAQSGQSYSFVTSNDFVVAKQKMPAGRYTVQKDGAGGFLIVGKGKPVRVLVVTRLARMTPADQPARFTFDALDTGEQLLSEIWLPGEDGYLVCTMERQHHHVTLSSAK